MTSTAPSSTRTAAGDTSRGKRDRNLFMTSLIKLPMLYVLVALLAMTTYIYPGFWDNVNLQNMLQQNVGLLLVSVGMTFVMISGGFDLSVGAIYATGAITFLSFDGSLPVTIAVVIAVGVGLLCGIVNGALINILHINPFVATLGTSSTITGLMTLYANKHTTYSASDSYSFLGNHRIGTIPLSTIIAIVIFIVAALVLAKSTYGRSVYAVGGNTEAARLSGIRVGLISASTFAIIGALAALGGVFTASQLGAAQPNFVGNVTLDAIAVVIIGGTSLMGGEGAMWRSAVGLAILAIVNNLFASQALDPSLQLVFKGIIVVMAVGFEGWSRRRNSA